MGAFVYVAAGFMVSRALLGTLGSEERLEGFGWRLGLLHLPNIVVTGLATLAAARTLSDEHRDSRLLYPLGALAVPLAGLVHGFAVSWDVVGVEGVWMPVASLATGAAVGLAVDRLLEDRASEPEPPVPYSYHWRSTGRTGAYAWRHAPGSTQSYRPPGADDAPRGDGGATAVEYPGVVVLVATLIGTLAAAGIGGDIGERTTGSPADRRGTAHLLIAAVPADWPAGRTDPVPLPPDPIRTARLVLREPGARDRAALIELLASPEVHGWFAGMAPGEPVVLTTRTANIRPKRLAAKPGFTEMRRYQAYGAEQWLGGPSPVAPPR